MTAQVRFAINTWTAAGSADYWCVNPPYNGMGTRIHAVCDGNFSFTVLATDLDPAVTSLYTDVTSFLTPTGVALVVANGFYLLGRNHASVRINVTSIQAAKTLVTGISFS